MLSVQDKGKGAFLQIWGPRAGLRNSLEQNRNLQKVLGREKNSVLNMIGSAEGNRLHWKMCA
jgi:hypothetical protein